MLFLATNIFEATMSYFLNFVSDFNPNKTDETGVTPPTIRVKVLRGNTEMSPGDQAFLGETLTMEVEVIDEGKSFLNVSFSLIFSFFLLIQIVSLS